METKVVEASVEYGVEERTYHHNGQKIFIPFITLTIDRKSIQFNCTAHLDNKEDSVELLAHVERMLRQTPDVREAYDHDGKVVNREFKN